MKNDRSASHPDSPAALRTGNAWTQFWFAPIPTTGLHCLRVGSGLLFIFWLASFLGHQKEFFSLTGWLDRQVLVEIQDQQNKALQEQNRALQEQNKALQEQNKAFDPQTEPAPLIGWSILYLAGDDPTTFQLLYFGSLVVLALFTLGVATRLTGVLSWIVIVSFLPNPVASYEGDYLLGILAFYLMLGYLLLGQWNNNLSLAERILGSRRDFLLAPWMFARSQRTQPLSYAANMTMRLLQIHLAIILVTSGLHKLQLPDWWAGSALFYPLHPPFQMTEEILQREMPNASVTLFFLSLIQYAVLAWEIGFPFFAWRRGWGRVLLLGGAVIYWAGALFVFKQPLFGPFVVLGCLSFLRPAEWAWLKRRLEMLWEAPAAENAETAPKKVSLSALKENIKK